MKEERRKLYHFTSSSGVTDINALHDAYGAYVQFSAFRSLFVINPSIFLLIFFEHFCCKKRERVAFRSFLFFALKGMKNHHKKSNRNLVKAHTHHTMLRKIAQTSVSRHAQMRNALANGSMVRVSRSHASLYFYIIVFFSKKGSANLKASLKNEWKTDPEYSLFLQRNFAAASTADDAKYQVRVYDV